MKWATAAAAVAVLLAWATAQPQMQPGVRLVVVTAAAGIHFKHENAASREKHLIETSQQLLPNDGGAVDRLSKVPANRLVTIKEGQTQPTRR